jgi:hypothetical protein
MEFTKRKGNANLQLTLTVVGASCGCVARAVRRLPRQRRLRRDVVPLRVDVGAPALMPHRTPRAAVPLDRRARCSPRTLVAPPANLPSFCGAQPPAGELLSSSSGVLPHPPARHARTTASTRGHPARRFRLLVVASEDLRLRREVLYICFFSLLRCKLPPPFAFSVGNRFAAAQCSLASHFCVCVRCWTQS